MAFTDLIRWRRPTPPVMSNEPFLSLQREMNRAFERFWNGGEALLGSEVSGFGFSPNVELTESDESVDVSAELPGMSDKDVRVTLSEDGEALVIQGEKKADRETRRESFYRAERVYGRFCRKLALPGRVDASRVNATFRDGVLRVHMPKLPDTEQASRQISVKAG